MRSLRRVVCLASMGIWIGCSVNQAGLTDGDVPTGTGVGTAGVGGAGSAGRGGGGGAAGSVLAGAGGTSSGGSLGASGGAGPAGSGGGITGTGGTAGNIATGGTTGVAGAGGTTGLAGTSGSSGIAGAGGSTGLAGTSGSAGSGAGGGTTGVAGTGGTGGAVGSAGTGGTAGSGPAGSGGRAGSGGPAGRGGNSGRGGTGGNPCAGYPAMARAFVTPTDNRVHCYWPRSSSQTWSEASQSCMMQNGHLVTILSAEENAFVVSMAQFSTSFSDTWIGATDGKAGGDRTGAGTYRWVTNETWSFTSWAQGEPDGFCDPCSGGQTCTCDHRATLVNDGTWTDRWADNTRSSVCEATPN